MPSEVVAARPRRGLLCLRRLAKHLGHSLPVTLCLASVLAVVSLNKPDWLKATDSASMRAVAQVDRWRAKVSFAVSDWLVAKALLSPNGAGELWWQTSIEDRAFELLRNDGSDSSTVLSLTPLAFQKLLGRQTPVPRERLACLIERLAERIAAQRALASRPEWLPIVAIDIDVTPVESEAIQPVPDPRMQASSPCWEPADVPIPACEAQPVAGVDGVDGLKVDARTQRMKCALDRLAQQAVVIAVVYPRLTGRAQSLRNDFIKWTCPAGSAESGSAATAARGVHYASAQLFVVPQDNVFEHVTKKKALNKALADFVGTGQERAAYQAQFDTWPDRFPGLGQAIDAARVLREAPQQAPSASTSTRRTHAAELLDHYCKAARAGKTTLLDDQMIARGANDSAGSVFDSMIPGAYEYQPIKLGPAMGRLTIKDIRSDDAADLTARAKFAFAELPYAQTYLLSVDSGTTEDKFLVPTLDEPVPGAWVHAAIAESLHLDGLDAAGSATDAESAPSVDLKYLGYFATELFFGLLFAAVAFAFGLATHRTPPPPNPVLDRIRLLTLPLLIAVGLSLVYGLCTARAFSHGAWSNPLPMMLGMALHSYGEAVEVASGHPSPPSLNLYDEVTRHLVRWSWAAVTLAALAWGSLVSREAYCDTIRVSAAVLAVVYCVLAMRWPWLPLPWRERDDD